MSNPFSNLFGSAAPAEDSSKKFHDEISKIFRITLNVEDPNESIILPGMIEEEFFNSSNLLDAITERKSFTFNSRENDLKKHQFEHESVSADKITTKYSRAR